MSSTAVGIALGTLLGLRHAFEPDHLTAVSTLVSETRDLRGGALLGALWGVGHTIALLAIGVIAMLVGASLPPRASLVFELCVALMLVVLGIRSIALARRAGAFRVDPSRRSRRHDHERRGDHEHRSDHATSHSIGTRARTAAWRPLAVGFLHGLAGSGALTAIVFAELHGTLARVLYLTLFGVGSIGGMALASGVAGATLHGFAHAGRTRRTIAIATGALSIIVGIWWTIPLWLQLAWTGASSSSKNCSVAETCRACACSPLTRFAIRSLHQERHE